MANFKRRKPKNARSGCLLCKPNKMNGAKHTILAFLDGEKCIIF